MEASGPAATTPERVPKYYRVKQRLREHIDALEPGSALPTERSLSERFATSRATVRQALQELAAEGRVVRIQGKGTFVLPPKVTVPLQLTSHTEAMRQRDMTPGSRVLRVETIPATAELGQHLEVDPDTPLVRISRLRLGDGVPMALENVHLVAAQVPHIDERMHDWTSLYELLREAYGIVPVAASQTIESAIASPSEAHLLDTDTGAPLLMLTRASWTASQKRVEFTSSVYRGDRYRFVTSLQPPP